MTIARRSFLLRIAVLCAAFALPISGTARAAALSSEQKQTLAEVNAYFNSVKTMHGDFIQFGPNGERAEGKFYLARPGKIRFYYNPPSKVDIIADGKSVSVKDRKLATQDIWPLSETPLRFLLASQINLEKDAEVASVSVEPDLVTVVLSDTSTFGTGKLDRDGRAGLRHLGRDLQHQGQRADQPQALHHRLQRQPDAASRQQLIENGKSCRWAAFMAPPPLP
jgi:outer membrane lipoprotein-sorting protein